MKKTHDDFLLGGSSYMKASGKKRNFGPKSWIFIDFFTFPAHLPTLEKTGTQESHPGCILIYEGGYLRTVLSGGSIGKFRTNSVFRVPFFFYSYDFDKN